MNEFRNAVVVASIFILIFLLGEILKHRWPGKSELCRKTVHFLSGIATLSFPFLFRSHWTVLLLTISFCLVLLASRRVGLLQSVHGVNRKSEGATYFPVAVYLTFLLAHDNPVLFFVPILVLTVSDSLAALLGASYGKITFHVEEGLKSLEGSLAFFLTTFLCVHIPLLLMTGIGRLESILIAMILAILVTGFEAVSLAGTDNLFIPFGAYFILSKMLSKPVDFLAGQLLNLSIVIAVVCMMVIPLRIIRTSAVIGLILFNHAAWSLCGIGWLIPLLVGQVFYLVLVFLLHRKRVLDPVDGFRIRAILFTGIVPTVLIFYANAIRDFPLVFVPYLAAVASQMAILTSTYWRIYCGRKGPVRWPDYLLQSAAWTALSVITVVLGPLRLYPELNQVIAITMIGGSVFMAQLLHRQIRNHSAFQRCEHSLGEYRPRMFATAAVSMAVLLVQLTLLGGGYN